MSEGIVLVSFVALALTTTTLFFAGTRIRAGHWLASLAAASVAAAVSWWLAERVDSTGLQLGHVVLVAIILTAISAAAFEDWTALGHVTMAFTFGASASFLVYAFAVLMNAQLGPWSMAFGIVLLVL